MTRWSHDVPRWPSGLRDDTPLPYAAWRVLDLVDGKRTLAQIAAHLDLAQEDVERALEQAQSWLGRALRREQPVTEAVLDNVTQALVSVVGPIGEFLIDDALDQVGEGPPSPRCSGRRPGTRRGAPAPVRAAVADAEAGLTRHLPRPRPCLTPARPPQRKAT
ncbi:PqqD family protein [Deinococcus radiodurans]|nr:PqqD family protein [Deinococcus radiodurans]